jgi:hypothetical protein
MPNSAHDAGGLLLIPGLRVLWTRCQLRNASRFWFVSFCSGAHQNCLYLSASFPLALHGVNRFIYIPHWYSSVLDFNALQVASGKDALRRLGRHPLPDWT